MKHFILSCVIGCAVLFPWNIIVSCPDFFIFLYGNSIYIIFSFVYSIPNGITLIIFLFVHLNIKFQVLISFFAIAIIFTFYILFTPFLSLLDTIGFVFILFLLTMFSIFEGILNSSLFAWLSDRDTDTTAYITGFAISGTITSVMRIITKSAANIFGNQNHWQSLWITTIIYFIIGLLVILLGIGSFIYLYYGNTREKIKYDDVKFLDVIKKSYLYLIMQMINMAITLIVFPSVITNIKTQIYNFQEWYTIIIIFLFNFFDMVGRFATVFFYLDSILLMILLSIRVICIPGLILCLLGFINSDIFPLVICSFFGFTNGYLCSNIVILNRRKCDNGELHIAGKSQIIAMMVGIFTGSILSILGFKFIPIFP